MAMVSNAYRDAHYLLHHPPPRFRDPTRLAFITTTASFSLSRTFPMDLKSCMTTVFILFLLLAVPGFSKEGPGSEVYEIDYRGPETHSHRPPPNRPGRGNSNGVRHGNLKKHPHQSKRQTAQKRHKEGKKA